MVTMMVFSSRREGWLWFWLMVVLGGIYATLGFTPHLASFLRENESLQGSLFFALFVSITIVAILFIRQRPGKIEIAVGVGVFLVYLSVWLRMSTLEERTHLFEYGLVSALVHEVLLERERNGRAVPMVAVTAFVISFLLGWLDEGIQWLLPNRVYDYRDVIFNGVAAALVIGGRWAVSAIEGLVQHYRKNN